MFTDLISLSKLLLADIRDANVASGLRRVGDLTYKLAECYDWFRGVLPVTFATDPAAEEADLTHLEIVAGDLADACRPTTAAPAGGEPAGLDPATIALLLQLGLQAAKFLAELIRERRRNRPSPA